ncbi:hypothetical protein JMJ56_24110 [Belnapia sp. T18]|uniref:Right handed beta helix region n=1 Tax=Belnapia arida TaxID=2804533 RepID=A0ABS1U8U5_9PROT|nr:hypothetical protein [Belnapia arida]MBL6081096.1 hypothetical protein [Belnapia arida]
MLQGTVVASRWPGVTAGAHIGRAARVRNAAALQAAVDRAASAGRFFELEPGLFEIESELGLVVPAADAFRWQGSTASHIRQFADNAPILSVGDTQHGRTYTGRLRLSGFRLDYARHQHGQPRSTALRLGLLTGCVIEDGFVSPAYDERGSSADAFRGLHVTSGRTATGFFSNTLRDLHIAGAGHCVLNLSIFGSGNLFQNVYVKQSGSPPGPRPVAAGLMLLDGRGTQQEGVFEQCNFEWASGRTMLQLENVRNLTFLSCHFEGLELTGRQPALLRLANAEAQLSACTFQEISTDAAQGEGEAALCKLWGQNRLTANGLHLEWNAASRVRRPLRVVGIAAGGPVDAEPQVRLSDISVTDDAGDNQLSVTLDDRIAEPVPGLLEEYRRGALFSTLRGGRLAVGPDHTHYGYHADAVLVCPAIPLRSCVVVLSNRVRADGPGAALPVPTGALVTVIREAGPPGLPEARVQNHDGRTLLRLAAPGSRAHFRFDGSHWSHVT